MLRVLFGELRDGRLKRLPYLGYSLLVGVIGSVVVLGSAFAIGAFESTAGGDLQSTQQELLERFGIPGLLLFVVLGLAFTFVHFNLVAKRARDMGLPGWLTVADIFVAGIVLSLILPQQANGLFDFVCWLALLLIPSGVFAKEKNQQP